jgi:hypothetical protein
VLFTVFEVILDRFYRHFLSHWNQTGVKVNFYVLDGFIGPVNHGHAQGSAATTLFQNSDVIFIP